MKRFIYICIVLLALGMTSPVAAAEWTLDKAHSTVQFSVKHIFSTVFGQFPDFDGTLIFDPDHPDQGRFDFTVRVASVDTGNTKRDSHLRSGDFFSEDKFPVMRFVSSGIMPQGKDKFLVTGTMTIKDTAVAMEIPFVFHGIMPSPFNKSQQVAGFDCKFPIDRLAFGVGNGSFYKRGLVDKTVQVRISVEALNTP